VFGAAYKEGCIGSERDPQRHNRMKRSLANGFSSRALVEQEPIINQCVDDFINMIFKVPEAREKGLDMTKWFEMVAFDILGEMSFGESFGAIKGSTWVRDLTETEANIPEGKPHFWSELVVKHVFIVTVLDNMRRYPFIVTMGRWVLPWLTTTVRNKHTEYTRAKVQQ
jgi:cytochrome P450